jgi:tRNA threonylcarbamoyladenosine biosynthesis protein TsaE
MEKTVQNLEEFEAEAARFVATISPRAAATLVTLSGNLGAGKTAFTKVIARELGIEEIVNSPTFVLEKIYQLAPEKPFKRLLHLDAYRLEKGSDLLPLGFDESMKDEGNLILVEWPEKVAEALPPPAVKISIEVLENGARKITYG